MILILLTLQFFASLRKVVKLVVSSLFSAYLTTVLYKEKKTVLNLTFGFVSTANEIVLRVYCSELRKQVD